MEIQTGVVKQFFYWINERHNIYLKRQAGEPWPWTDDEIFQTYKFTNVFRELDAGTVWYRENWREPFADHEKLFFNTCLYRSFNWIGTAEYLGYTLTDMVGGVYGVWDANQVEEDLRYRREQGFQIFTGAHMLTGTLGGPERKDKVWQVVHVVLDHMWRNEDRYIPKPGDTLQAAFERLKEAPGFGPFISYEVITDLRHTRYLRDARDVMTWANPGPGAIRGINRMYGIDVRKHPGATFPKDHYIEIMRWLLVISPKHLGSHVPSLEMRDIEHSLCEFDKYLRAKHGEGRPRSKFIPPHMR